MTAADKIVPLREQITGVTGELNDMANTMGDNVQGALAGLSSAWEAFMLSFYESKGVMKEVIDFLSRGIRNIANDMKDYDQLQEDANNRAVANAQSEMAQSNILERHRNNMFKLYEEKIKEGMSADKAAIAAKEEYLQTLQSQLDIENKEYSDGIKKRENLEKEVEDRGLFRKGTIYGWLYDKTSIGRTKKVIEEDIKTATTAAAGKKAIASITESIIDDLNKVDLKQVEVSQNTLGKNLTDKELKELEKQRKERLRIQQEYQQSELDLMDEGLGKELAKIRLNYTKRIAAVKGNTQEEIKTRENLAVAMEDELSEKIYTYNQNKEKINLQNRLEALSTNSKDELDQRLSIQLQVNEILRDAEVKAAKKAGEDVEAVNKKYDKKASDIAVKNALERIGLIEKNTTKETNIVQNAAENDLRKEELRYRKGEINEKEYRQKVYEITKDSIQEQLKLLNIQLQAELAALDPTNAKSDEIKKKIETVKAEIKKLNNEIEDLTYGKEKSDRQDWADGFINAMSNMRGVAEDYLGDTVNLFSSFYNIIGKLTDEFVETGNFSLSKWWENLDPKEKAAVILETYASLFD